MDMLKLKISNQFKHISEPLEVSKRKFTPEQKQRLAKASIDFESLLTEMMLKSMTKTTEGGLLGKDNGLGTDVFSSIFEGKLAEYMSRSQSIGVASMLYEKMTGEKLDLEKFKAEELRSKIPPARDFDFDNEKVIPHSSALGRLKKFEPLIKKISEKFGVSDKLIKSVILAESAAKPDAVSRANAKGLMQLMDTTTEEMGINDPFNPEENIYGGTKYLSTLLNDFEGEIDSALAAYNAGPENVKKYGGIPPFEETQNYVKRVKAYLKYFEGE